jgi:xylulose-5-phosphate/fructose-6-phosphate phosphoketolase
VLRQDMADERLRHRMYTREHGDDMADVRDWVWPFDGVPSAAMQPAPAGAAGSPA